MLPFASVRPAGTFYLLPALRSGVSEWKGAYPQVKVAEETQLLRSLDKGVFHFLKELISDIFRKLPIAPGTRVTGKHLTSC